MKKSYYAIAGLLGAIGMVELQLVTPSHTNAAGEMTSAAYMATAKKPVPAARAASLHATAGKSHAAPQVAAAAAATIAASGHAAPAAPAAPALALAAPIGESLPIRLIASIDAGTLAPGGFGDAGSLLAATSRASAFVRLPGDSPGPILIAFGAPYGAVAAGNAGGVPVGTGLGGGAGVPIGTHPATAPTPGDDAMMPVLVENAGSTDQGGIDNRYLDGLSAYAAGVQASPDYFAADTFTPSSMMSSVPDSQTWTTLIAGLALVGFSMRRRSGLRHVSS